jgi:GNAT superfamily N-acetyltransferase
VYPVDDLPTTVHVGAFDDEGRLAACGTFFRESYAGDPARDAWRLRGMATDAQRQGRGFGAAVLERGLREIAERRGELLWCNARATAAGFYLRHGFELVGDRFDIAPLGAHVVAVRRIDSGPWPAGSERRTWRSSRSA